MDTRCYRVDGYAHWYNLDLPETIAVRERLLADVQRIFAVMPGDSRRRRCSSRP